MSIRRKPSTRSHAAVLRYVAQWRRVSARLQVLMNDSTNARALATEAHALQRQCERMASDLQTLAAHARRPVT